MDRSQLIISEILIELSNRIMENAELKAEVQILKEKIKEMENQNNENLEDNRSLSNIQH